jgi:transcriptional regulator with XRE-family HTH domain
VRRPRVDALHRRVIKRIRALAEAKGVALSHLPDRAAVARSHFWNVMAGKKSPTLKWLGKIATSLDGDVEDLVKR